MKLMTPIIYFGPTNITYLSFPLGYVIIKLKLKAHVPITLTNVLCVPLVKNC